MADCTGNSWIASAYTHIPHCGRPMWTNAPRLQHVVIFYNALWSTWHVYTTAFHTTQYARQTCPYCELQSSSSCQSRSSSHSNYCKELWVWSRVACIKVVNYKAHAQSGYYVTSLPTEYLSHNIFMNCNSVSYYAPPP